MFKNYRAPETDKVLEDSGSPSSTIATSEANDYRTPHDSSPVRQDPRTSLLHVIDAPDSSRNNTPTASFRREEMEDEGGRGSGAETVPAPKAKGGRKRKDPAMLGSIFSGNKIKHLKKDDGEPLWRKDIQYDFLKAVFDDDKAVFTNSYEPLGHPKQTFADLYIDTMARSSKTSKILRDKLLTEHEPAKNMAMVCLLVNLGRMNTTLNFFPEMRAQLRTYHAIPSLQAHQDPNSYKQLQDAPRLKSILKGASEDRVEPSTVDKIKDREVPRTNPVNLIFVLSQFAPKITELHFPDPIDFYDMLMAEHISSRTRANAFLWLMWFYLESDFTEEGADENPFGSGVDYQVGAMNQGVPRFQFMNAEEEALENVDTPEEIEYGNSKMRERKRIIEADQAAFQAEHGPPKRGPKPKIHLPPDEVGGLLSRIRPKYEDGASPAYVPSVLNRMRPKYESDLDSTRSTPPPRNLSGARVQGLSTGKVRGSLKNQIVDGSSPAAPNSEPVMRRSRPLTAHQLAVEKNRNQRVDYILSRGLRKQHHRLKKLRKQDGPFWRAIQRTQKMPDHLDDSDVEDSLIHKDPYPFKDLGYGGLVQLQDEVDDFGEELASYAAAFRRMGRRLHRWDAQKDLNLGVMGTNRIVQGARDDAKDNGDDTDEEPRRREPSTKQVSHTAPRWHKDDKEWDENLDPMDREILGLQSDADEDLDDVDKALLGIIPGDETEGEESGMDVD